MPPCLPDSSCHPSFTSVYILQSMCLHFSCFEALFYNFLCSPMLNLISRSLKKTFHKDLQYSSKKAKVPPNTWFFSVCFWPWQLAHPGSLLLFVSAWAAHSSWEKTSTKNPWSAAWAKPPAVKPCPGAGLGHYTYLDFFYFLFFLHLLILIVLSARFFFFFLFTPRNLHKMCGRES